MKLHRTLYTKNLLLICLITFFLISLTMVSVPVKPQPYETRIYFRESPPGSWVPGVNATEWVYLTVDIESPDAWDNTPQGIIGYEFSINVDPSVLLVASPLYKNQLGCWLYDFIDYHMYYGHEPLYLVEEINQTTGHIVSAGENIAGWETLGVGAGGDSNATSLYGSTYGLMVLRFRSQSLTEYTRIDIYNANYITINASAPEGYNKIPFDVVDDGHYNQPPPVHSLTVESTPIDGVDFTINATGYTTNATVELEEGSYTVTMPDTWTVGPDQYNFLEWEDNTTDPVRSISLISNITITATYELAKEYTLTINSEPITGINFTVDGITNATNWSDSLRGGSYTVSMPSTWVVGTDKYNFRRWEDDSTNRVRSVSLTSNMTITATYVPVYSLTVESTPIDGVDFTINATGYTTNATVELEEGSYTVTMPDNWRVGISEYFFRSWEDNSTNPVRSISLTVDRTITAKYGPPIPYNLTVNSEPITGINFTIDVVTTHTTNWTGPVLEGDRLVEMPATWTTPGGDIYRFDHWEDNSTYRFRDISLKSNMTITATYVPVYSLTVESTPIDGVDFTINATGYTTNATVELEEGSYTVTMPDTWTVGADQYEFVEWEDASTNPVRVISLTSNLTITATYVLKLVPVASFTFSPTEPIVAETVTFDASASNDPDGTIVSHAWDFGDGASGSGEIVDHVYTTDGTYDVTLTVTDNEGLTQTLTKSITVEEAPSEGIPFQLIVAAAGAAGIVIVAIVLYYLKIRKPTPT